MATYDQLVGSLRVAHAMGDDAAATKLANAIRNKDYDDRETWYGALGEGALQGATFGFADELAGFGAGVGSLFGEDETYSEAYTRKRDDLRDDYAKAQRDRAGWTFGGELLGGAATGFSGLGRSAARSLAQQTFRQAAPKLALQGAGYGGLAGAGYSEADVGSGAFAGDVLGGAATGGVLAPAIPGAIAGGKNLARKAVELMPKRGAKMRAERMLRHDVSDELSRFRLGDEFKNMSSEEAAAYIHQNKNLLAGDLAPETTRALVYSGTDAGAELGTKVMTRQASKHARVDDEMMKMLGVRGKNYFDEMDKLIQIRRAKGQELYRNAHSVPVSDDLAREMAPILKPKKIPGIKNPKYQAGYLVNKAAKKAREMAAADGYPIGPEEMYGMRHLDYLSRALKDDADQFFRGKKSGPKSFGKNAREAADKIDSILYKHNPALQDARGEWSGDLAVEAAMRWGKNALRQSPRLTKKEFMAMSMAEKHAARLSVAEELMTTGSKKGFSSDITLRLREQPLFRELVKTMFKNKTVLTRFLNQLRDEKIMGKTAKAVDSGAPPVRPEQNLLGGIGGLVAGTQIGERIGGHTMATAALGKRIGQQMGGPTAAQNYTAQEAAKILSGRGDALRQLLQPTGVSSPTLAMPRLTSALPGAAGILGGSQ